MKLITIIVPMFNEENNIEQCVVTLRNQINQNFNVVFIDDGSTDNTLFKLESLLNTQNNFNYRIIKQSNKGAAEARKVGIKTASTEYVMIYDCDDLISHNMTEAFYNTHANYNNADIIIPNLSIQQANGTWKSFVFFSNKKVLDPIESVKYTLDGWKIHGSFAIRKNIMLKSYADYKKYNPKDKNFVNNDEVITRLNFINSKVIARSSGIYYYCFNSSSTTKKINSNLYLKIENALIIYRLFHDIKFLTSSAKAELVSTMWGVFRILKVYNREITNENMWHNLLQETLLNVNYFSYLKSLPAKQKLQISILKINYLLKKNKR